MVPSSETYHASNESYTPPGSEYTYYKIIFDDYDDKNEIDTNVNNYLEFLEQV